MAPDTHVSEDEAETILPIRVPDTHVSEDGLLGNYGLQRAWTPGREGVREPGPWGATALPLFLVLGFVGADYFAVKYAETDICLTSSPQRGSHARHLLLPTRGGPAIAPNGK